MLIKQNAQLFELKNPKDLKLVYVHGKGVGLFADREFKRGKVVIHFEADIVPCSKASPEAVQISEDKCFDSKWLTPEAFINHSCSPNTKLDIEGQNYTAIKNIRKDEEITFNYLTTDWDMGEDAFECRCESKNCYGKIQGLKYLSKEQQKILKPYILSFLQKKIEKSK